MAIALRYTVPIAKEDRYDHHLGDELSAAVSKALAGHRDAKCHKSIVRATVNESQASR